VAAPRAVAHLEAPEKVEQQRLGELEGGRALEPLADEQHRGLVAGLRRRGAAEGLDRRVALDAELQRVVQAEVEEAAQREVVGALFRVAAEREERAV
jgi:hypothetical protein